MNTFTSRAVWVLLAAAFVLSGQASAQQERQWGKDRTIQQVSEHVYRWGSDNQFGAFIATSEGIIVVDGHYCPSGTVQWLQSELKKRYTVPVKYVIISHDHQDHNCHTGVFADTAVTVGHRLLLPHLIREQRNSAVPAITFEDAMDIHLGGVKVSLLYFGPTHSDNLIQVHVPDERVLISIDLARGRGLFPDLRDMEVDNQLRTYKILSRLENVDIVLPGHGPVLTQDSFMETYRFYSALRERVLQYMVEGKPLSEIRQLVKMEDFKDYAGVATLLDPNIVTMYQYLYRYREPNSRITDLEAVDCIENVQNCRTSDPPKGTAPNPRQRR